jgi:hypothetical protein
MNKNEKEEMQKRGYMIEHLLCFYSMVSSQTVLYEDTFPVFLNNFGEADAILFGLGKEKPNRFECVEQLAKLPINTLNIISPIVFHGSLNVELKYVDWDYHINVNRFDFDLKGREYRNIRHRLRQVDKIGYQTKQNRKVTSNHIYILSRHMKRHKLDVWDYEELLSLERFFREHDHGMMIEAYKDDRLVGFDVVDFFEDKRIMAVPLGIYLGVPMISDFLMYENLKLARNKGCNWIDVGPTCGIAGLKRFKEKWFAKPKYKLCVQTLRVESEKNGSKQGKTSFQ